MHIYAAPHAHGIGHVAMHPPPVKHGGGVAWVRRHVWLRCCRSGSIHTMQRAASPTSRRLEQFNWRLPEGEQLPCMGWVRAVPHGSWQLPKGCTMRAWSMRTAALVLHREWPVPSHSQHCCRTLPCAAVLCVAQRCAGHEGAADKVRRHAPRLPQGAGPPAGQVRGAVR